ncbi:hypothetical protein BDV06DRAFT_179745 [Aspergillus oleicola]
MASEHPNPSSTLSNTDEKDIPQTTPAAPTSTTSAATATAPSYFPVYATAQPSSVTVLPEEPTSTVGAAASVSSSPPPPQPGAVPDPLSTEESEANPPPPAPAPKSGPAPTAAPVSTQTPPPSATEPNPHPPPITAAPTYPPPSNPNVVLPTSTSTTGNITHDPNTPQTAAAHQASYSYQPTPGAAPGVAPGAGAGYAYPSSYSYSYTPTTTQPIQQQQTYAPPNPNTTSTPYNTLYSPPASSTGATLPLHNPSTGGVATGLDLDPGLGSSENEGGVWGDTKSWLASAGNKLAEVEKEVWRRINDAHDK